MTQRKCVVNFEKLKQLLTNAPMLKIEDPDRFWCAKMLTRKDLVESLCKKDR